MISGFEDIKLNVILGKIKDLNDREFILNLIERDPLTKLLNRGGFDAHLEAEIKEVERSYNESDNSKNEDVSLLIIDVDFFKDINDKYGHLNGDIVLRAIADILKKNVRPKDIICRWGGEEFAAILPNTAVDEGIKVAERLRKKIEEDCKFYFSNGLLYIIRNDAYLDNKGNEYKIKDKNKIVNVTISVGLSNYKGICENSSELIGCADEALYKAKENGRNKVEGHVKIK